MHIIQTPVPMRSRRKVYLPNQRIVVNDVGLGGFNIGKMFKRMIHFTPRSFQPKNIFGAIGSVTATVATGGLAPIISGKTFGAHSKLMKDVGIATTAVAAAAGAVVAFPAIVPAVSGALSTVGSGLTSVFGGVGSLLGGATRFLGGMFGGGGGGGYGGSGMYMGPQAVIDPNALMPPGSGVLQNPSQDVGQQIAQAVPQMVVQSLTPTSYPTMPDPNAADSSAVDPSTQLQSPSSQDFQTINPVTGQPIVKQDYTTYYLVGGGLVVAGLIYYYRR